MQLISHIFLPATLAGALCCFAWRIVPVGRLRTSLQIVGPLLLLGLHPVVLFFLYQSLDLLPYQQAVFALWGTALGVVSWIHVLFPRSLESKPQLPSWWFTKSWTNQEKKQSTAALQQLGNRPKNRFVLAIVGVAFSWLGLTFAWQWTADTFHAREPIQGRIDKIVFRSGSRAPRLGLIYMHGSPFNATRDILRIFRPGDWARFEIGAGSHAILKAQPLPTPPAAPNISPLTPLPPPSRPH